MVDPTVIAMAASGRAGIRDPRRVVAAVRAPGVTAALHDRQAFDAGGGSSPLQGLVSGNGREHGLITRVAGEAGCVAVVVVDDGPHAAVVRRHHVQIGRREPAIRGALEPAALDEQLVEHLVKSLGKVRLGLALGLGLRLGPGLE